MPKRNNFAFSYLSRRESGSRDILDHSTFGDDRIAGRLEEAGWIDDRGIFRHPDGYFPEFVRRPGVETTYFRVESLNVFANAWPLADEIEGMAHGPVRRAIAFRGVNADFGPFERAGYNGFETPTVDPEQMRAGRVHLQALMARRRQFDTVEQGLAYTELLAT